MDRGNLVNSSFVGCKFSKLTPKQRYNICFVFKIRNLLWMLKVFVLASRNSQPIPNKISISGVPIAFQSTNWFSKRV